MYVRTKPNKSGSTSVQIISKERGCYKVVKSMGSATTRQEIDRLITLANQEIEKLSKQSSLFLSEKDDIVEQVFASLNNSNIQTIGLELIFGIIFDHIGFNKIQQDLFRHLVIARLAFPLSKLKTTEYLYRYQGITLEADTIYRFMDKLNSKLKQKVEQIAYKHTYNLLGGDVNVVFYDMTTLYFEASDQDDLRKTGFSKDGKHPNPQIYIGLLVGLGGYAIGYDIYEGNTYEGHTLIPFLENMRKKFNLEKPLVIADSGLLSRKNIEALEEKGYSYIIGARLKNESDEIKAKITEENYIDGMLLSIPKSKNKRLVIHYSTKRASKDEYNRKRGLKRLEKRVKSGKLTKSNINNRGYNKYLKLEGDVSIDIDYEKFKQDKIWDGLKVTVYKKVI
jgi:transposase